MTDIFNNNDKIELRKRGIEESKVKEQLNRFATGFPYLRLDGSANTDFGIVRLDAKQQQTAVSRWEKYLADGGSVTKFVPASGAASRMFKALFAFVNGDSEQPIPGSDVAQIIDRIEDMPFYGELNENLIQSTGKDIAALKKDGEYRRIVAAIVNADGLNYGNLPKGLLAFHRYADGEIRTPVEEQMVEGAQTAATNGKVNLHFTVSSNHKALFKDKIEKVAPTLEKRFGVKYNIGLSEQKPSTDTVAANPDNSLFRDEKGQMVFRPGGHGALIENLNDIDSTVVFIKNIDNIVPDNERESTIQYKKVLGGLLIEVHDSIENYLRTLRKGTPTRSELLEMLKYLETVLCTKSTKTAGMTDSELATYLEGKFNRPLRVCGMVVNEGEPGGGPYIAFNEDGSSSPQILESTQIDKNNPEAVSMMAKATHFNPVDLVCYITDIYNKKFDLTKYVDHNTGFISEKSLGGKDLRALELPGLWNGAMSDWSTVFVEVPASTFNPVKTVNDLLRPVHQADKQ